MICILCGKEFEPLPLPRLERLEVEGKKSVHNLVCCECALEQVNIFLTLVGNSNWIKSQRK